MSKTGIGKDWTSKGALLLALFNKQKNVESWSQGKMKSFSNQKCFPAELKLQGGGRQQGKNALNTTFAKFDAQAKQKKVCAPAKMH